MKRCGVIMVLVLVCSCKQREKIFSQLETIPGNYYVQCLEEGVLDIKRPDTTIQKTVIADSIIFTAHSIKNCCGWFDSLRVILRNDTVTVESIKKSDLSVSCDCNCLFKEVLAFRKNYFDSSNHVFRFFGKTLAP